ncbi:uncharacterized protein FTJAE_2891 [Fusarium tjaetaba]|uniref:Uncharacterized protein n=1 Tax=Fusarium tjaetaba TaxID=1567544 RepID=A0A8H5S2C4_9HYPO|nr:uncharacterized protein FTJAE_2891 [Fusarium tjaetaba]KAF5644202.1 hypothetical protein FTJAE_2891 [Fusarium tjaetaba]
MSHVPERLGKFLDQQEHPGVFLPRSAIKVLEIQVEAVPVLDPRTARDQRQGFDDVRCFPRIAQAIKEPTGLVGIYIECVVPRKLDVSTSITTLASPTSWPLFLKLRAKCQLYMLVMKGEVSLTGHLIPRIEVFDICRYVFCFLQQLVLVNRIKHNSVVQNGDNAILTLARMVKSDLRHLRRFAFSFTSGFGRTVIYRDEDYDNISDVFLNDYGDPQINFIKSLVVDMMGHLPQLDETCILPTRQHLYQGNECWETVSSTGRICSI